MKCKDCIHYTAHKHFYFGEEDFDEYFNDDNVKVNAQNLRIKKNGRNCCVKWVPRFICLGSGMEQVQLRSSRFFESSIQNMSFMWKPTSKAMIMTITKNTSAVVSCSKISVKWYFSQEKLPKRHSQKGAGNEQMH